MGFHAKYPSMERQDLTQAQLGAFKFTPVDEAVRQLTQPHPLLFQQYTQAFHSAGFHSPHINTSDTSGHPSFFDNQIKPSLDNCRLRLGPAMVRSAVEGVDSNPQKRFGHPAHVQNFQPGWSSAAEMESIPSLDTSESNSAPISDFSAQFTNANTSLLKALEAEQEAHEVTKSRLEHQLNAFQEAEAETRRLTEHNRALLNSIKLLQSTVKHMVQKEACANEEKQAKQHVQDFKIQAEGKDTSRSILYDVVACYKPEQAPNSINDKLQSGPDPNDTSGSSHSKKSEGSEMSRRLRIEAIPRKDDEVNKSAEISYREKIAALVKNGYEDVNHDTTCDNEVEYLSDGRHVGVRWKDGAAKPHDLLSTNENQTFESREGFVYDIPQSFLVKYGTRPIEKDLNVSGAPETGKEKMTVVSCAASDASTGSNDYPKILLMPDPVLVNWKIDTRHIQELKGRRFETHTGSHFEQHPIRYVPSILDDDLFRTVMIDFIPYGTRYGEVLSQIRGGTLEQIQLYGPIGDATDFVTARVIFIEESGANHLFKQGQDPGIFINDQRVRVWQVLEPTYPKSKELQQDIYKHGHTRIIDINAPIVAVEHMLKRKLCPQIEAGMVLDIGTTPDGYPTVEFTSIEEATKALATFINDPEFAGADFDFADDPCAANYE